MHPEKYTVNGEKKPKMHEIFSGPQSNDQSKIFMSQIRALT